MSAYQGPDKKWRYRKSVTINGKSERLSGTPDINTKAAAEQAEREHIAQLLNPPPPPTLTQEVPTFQEWFHGQFWKEWVIGRKNKPTEVRSKKIIYECHLGPALGHLRLNEITTPVVARLRADLVAAKLGDKRINNVLAVVSKPLKYAVDCEVIAKAPKIGMFKVERPEIVAWDFEQYARLLQAAKAEGEDWYAAVCLAGEAGLRVGEVKALRWREDVDMIARTLTVNQQTCNSVTTTPKGRTRRTIPMTVTLYEALKRMNVIREGFVVRDLDGAAKTDGQADGTLRRICRKAGLPVRVWHTLRHSYGTHAALFGVNPWRLQTWMGHKRIDETMLYVHVAEAHARDLPECVHDAAVGENNPDVRIVKMLGARAKFLPKMESTETSKAAVSAA